MKQLGSQCRLGITSIGQIINQCTNQTLQLEYYYLGVRERFATKIAFGKQILNFDEIKTQTQNELQVLEKQSEKSNARRGNKPNQRKVVKEGVDILTMNYDREPKDTENSLELILNTLCRAFQMKPKQAAALLTNNNQFLIHSIVKGIKGRYEPLLSWYQDLYANSKHLTTMLELETEQFPQSANCQKLLATISCGLYSHNLDICKWCNKLLTKVGYDFGQSQMMFDIAMNWFLEKEGGLELSLHALKKHPDFTEDFVSFVTQYATVKDQMEVVYKTQLKNYFSSPLEYVSVINDLFPFLIVQCPQEIQNSKLLDFWIEQSIRQADNDGKYSYDERIAALTLLSEIWLSFTNYVDQQEEVPEQFLQMLKRGVRDKHKPIRAVTVSLMFKLLEKFAEEKNNSAPAIYKALIFSVVESPQDPIMRELHFVNFISLFENQANIPIGLLIEPLIKQIQVLENETYFYEIFDFDFFSFVAKHQKLTLVNAIPLVDLLAKIYLNDVVYSSAACVPFVQLCSRFINEEAMQEFIIKFETICLSMLMGLEKNAEELQARYQQMQLAKSQPNTKSKRILALPAPPAPPKKYSNKKMTREERLKKLKEEDEDVNRRLKKTHIVEISLRIQNLKNDDINEQLKDMLLSTNKRFSELYGYYNKGIMALLKWWGDPDQIMGAYVRAIEEHEARIREEQERKEREEQERIRREQEEKERIEREEREARQAKLKEQQLKNEEDERRLMIEYDPDNPNVKDGQIISRSQSMQNALAVQPYTQSRASLQNAKAQQEIEKIKRSKIEKEEQKRLEEERKRLLSARKKKKLKEQLDKRKYELGIANITNEPNVQALIYKEGTVEKEDEKFKKALNRMMIPQIQLLDLDLEEERDKESVLSFMKKYAKLWKNLYYKYANSGFSSKQISNFDQLNEKNQTINFAEMTKLLKDHQAFPSLINKEELATLFRKINTKLFNRSDLQALDYNGYLAFILQLAYFCFTRPPKDLSHLPPVETLRALVSHFEEATRSRGNSTVLYEDPDITSIGDQQLIKALNEKLREDPNYPIPEGYFKQIEKTDIYEYRIPDAALEQMSEGNIISVELMDELINDLFSFHLLEPLVTFEERLKVRPMIKNGYKPQAEALNYMKKIDRKVRSSYENTLNPYTNLSAIDKSKLSQEVKPQLNLALKLEVAQYPLKERPYMQEVAEVLEEVLQATEKGLDYLPPRLNRAPGQIMNEAKIKRSEEQQKEKEIKITKEDKRKKRDEQVKNELQRLKEQKERELEEQRREREERERSDIDNKKRQQEDYRRKIESKKKQMEDEKLSKLEEVQRKKEEDEERNRENEERKKRERTEFMKKQKQKMEEEFNQIKKEREDVAAKQEELKKKEQEYSQRIRTQMEKFIKESQQERGKEQEERKQINEFFKSQDVENVFALYDKSLRYMFKFYASQDKKDLDFNLERSMNTMNLREFVRFGYQQYVIPVLLQPDDIVQVFRSLIRERIEEISGGLVENYIGDKNNAQVIDYEFFKKALIRIAVMAQDQLGGLKEDLLFDKLEKETKLKEEEMRKKEKLRKHMEDKAKAEKDAMEELKEEFKQQTMKGSSSKKEIVEYEIDEGVKKKEDAFFEKWMKQREAQGISLKKRIIGRQKEGTTRKRKIKTIKKEEENNEDEEIREGQDMDDGDHTTEGYQTRQSPAPGSIRKTKETKLLKDLTEQEQLADQLASTKIENKRVKKDLNVLCVSAKTIEGLLRYLGIQPEDSRYVLDRKLNEHRIEIQGQKPNKIIKMQVKPNKLDNVKEPITGGQIANQQNEENQNKQNDDDVADAQEDNANEDEGANT